MLTGITNINMVEVRMTYELIVKASLSTVPKNKIVKWNKKMLKMSVDKKNPPI